LEIYVHDTASLLAGLPALLYGKNYTTPDNLREVKDAESRKSLFIYQNKLIVMEPEESYVKKIKEVAKELGERLSITDIKVLALALQLRGVILSDDYGVLNVAQSLGIKWRSVRTKGITRKMRWENYCPNCKRTYPPELRECPVCGSPLARRPKFK